MTGSIRCPDTVHTQTILNASPHFAISVAPRTSPEDRCSAAAADASGAGTSAWRCSCCSRTRRATAISSCRTIEERSGGRWRPSPGSVYPTLQQLEDQGLIRAVERDGTKLYELTDAGREHLNENPEAGTAPWDADADAPDIGDLDCRSRLTVAAAQVMHAGDADQTRRASEVIAQTRRALYRILAEDTDG